MYHKSQELTSQYTKGTFIWIPFETMPSCALQGSTQIGQMLFVPLRLYNHIINVYFHNLADEFMKNIIHGSLIRGTGIL